MPLKFGSETLTTVTCARAKVTLEDRNGNVAGGWGETPMSVQWVWPEEAIHPGLFKRRNGVLDLSTISGPGFGYSVEEIQRELGDAC